MSYAKVLWLTVGAFLLVVGTIYGSGGAIFAGVGELLVTPIVCASQFTELDLPKDDPPDYLFYNAPPALGRDQKDPTHTSNFGVKLLEKMSSVKVPCELVYPGAEDVKHAQVVNYLIDKLAANN